MVAWAVGVLQLVNIAGPVSNIIPTPAFLSRARDWVSDQIPWPPFDFFAVFRNAFEWFVNLITTGFLDAIGLFFTTGLEIFLLYDNPRYIDELNEYWIDSLVLYLFIVMAMMFAYYVMMMLLADTDDADVQRIVERLILSGIFLFISREVYGFFVALTNEITYQILPDDYTFYVGMEMLEVVTTGAGMAMTALFIAVFGGIGILVSGILFYIILAMRMLIIYLVYAIMPVLLALWVVDVGPGKYGKFFADFMFKIAAVMMVLGIVIAGILAVGAAFGDPTASEGVDMASDYDTSDDGTIVISTEEYGPQSGLSGDAEGGEFAADALSDVIFSIFMFLGAIWLVIAVFTSMFGMVMSAGSASPGGTGGFRGKRTNYGGRGGGAAGGAAGGFGGQVAGNTAGSAHVYQMGDGRQVVANPAGGGVVVNPDAGAFDNAWETFGPENNPLASENAPPNPFNDQLPGDQVPLSEKAGHIGSETKGTLSDIGGFIGDKAGVDVNSKVARGTNAVSGAADSVAGAAGSIYDRIPQRAKNAGNLLKRGGRAYASVFKQPDVASSVGEMGRIARESPIGHPNKPGGNQEAGAIPEDQVTANDDWLDQWDLEGIQESGYGEPWGEGPTDDPMRNRYDGESELHQGGVTGDDIEYMGRGPGLPRDENGNLMYGPEPTVSGPDGAHHRVVHNQAGEIAGQMGIEGYEDITADDILTELESSAELLDKFGIEHSGQFDRQQIEFMLEHQQKMGVPADIAVQRTTEAMLNKHADPVGGLHVDHGVLDEFGVEPIPENLATDAPARRINLGKEGSGGVHGDHMWRIERNDGSTVYAQDVVTADQAGRNAIQTEAMLKKLGVSAPDHHYDAVGRVIRAEGIEGAQLKEVLNGTADINPENIDREQFLDAYAGMGLTGHTDCHDENVIVTEDGEVVPIDFDFAGSSPNVGKPRAIDEATQTADHLGIDVSEEDVVDRMESMANDYVDEVDSTGELVSSRMADVPDDIDRDLVDENTPDGMHRPIDRQVERETELAKQRGEKMDKAIEEVANGETSWQKRVRGENKIDSDAQASQSDIDDAFADLDEGGDTAETFDDLKDEYSEDLDLDDPNATSNKNTSSDSSSSKSKTDEEDYDVTLSDVWAEADSVLDDEFGSEFDA